MTAAIMKVTGTTDAAEIAAVLAAISFGRAPTPGPSRYEHWRRVRVAALRASVDDRASVNGR